MAAIISSVPALNAIVKGVGATFTLDKSELALVASVAASPYYSVQSNWKSVQLNYQGVGTTQSEPVSFDPSEVSPTALFNVVTQGVDLFNIESISILDFQNGYFVIPRSELTVVDFDVDMTPIPAYLWDIFYNNIATTGSGELHRTGGGNSWDSVAYYNTAQTGDFVFSGQLNFADQINDNIMLGYVKSAIPAINSGLPLNQTTSIYIDAGPDTASRFIGTGNTSVNVGSQPIVAGTYSFSITRVSGVITAIFDGQTIFTDNYAGTLFISGIIYNIGGGTILSASVT